MFWQQSTLASTHPCLRLVQHKSLLPVFTLLDFTDVKLHLGTLLVLHCLPFIQSHLLRAFILYIFSLIFPLYSHKTYINHVHPLHLMFISHFIARTGQTTELELVAQRQVKRLILSVILYMHDIQQNKNSSPVRPTVQPKNWKLSLNLLFLARRLCSLLPPSTSRSDASIYNYTLMFT